MSLEATPTYRLCLDAERIDMCWGRHWLARPTRGAYCCNVPQGWGTR